MTDQKARAIFSSISDHISSGSYHERDVLTLLMLLRPFAMPGTPLRELSNFIAHRTRDRGMLHERLQAMKAQVEGEVAGHVEEQDVYSASDILASINKSLAELGSATLPASSARDITFCVMSLLQDIRFASGSGEVGRLVLGFADDQVVLYGAVRRGQDGPPFLSRLLGVQNRYIQPISGDSGAMVPTLDRIVEAAFEHDRPMVRLL